MTLSVVLPCFNEERNAPAAVRDTAQWMRKNAVEGEIIAVDDGSKDRTLAALEDMRNDVPNLRIVHRAKNGGYGIAVRAGCDEATTDIVAFMDSDGQFKADDLSLLLPHMAQYPFVTGRRRSRADGFVRNTFGKILGAMNVIVLGLWVRDVNCGMKMFKREIWREIRPEHGGVEKLFNTEMFLHLKHRNIPWYQVDVPHYPRRVGNQTGGSIRVILRMFRELMDLRRAFRRKGEPREMAAVAVGK